MTLQETKMGKIDLLLGKLKQGPSDEGLEPGIRILHARHSNIDDPNCSTFSEIEVIR